MNELEMCRHGLVERYCSLPVKAVWSAGCANGPFDICELTTGVETDKGKDMKREGKVRVLSPSGDLKLMHCSDLFPLIASDH